MRRIIRWSLVSTAALAGVATVVLLVWIQLQPAAMPAPHRFNGLTIEQVQTLQQLVTSRVVVTDVVTSEVYGQTGSMRALIALRGELTVGVDLQQAKLVDVDERACEATLVLPQPVILSAKVDHGSTRLANLSSHGLWQWLPADQAIDAGMINSAYAAAQKQLDQTRVSESILKQSRDQAERVIRSYAQQLRWQIHLRWQP